MSEERKENNKTDITDQSKSDIKKDNNPFSGLNLEQLLNAKKQSTDTEKKNDEKIKNKAVGEQNDSIAKDFKRAMNEGVEKINEQIGDANKQLEDNVKAYNSKLVDRKKIIKNYGENIFQTINDEHKKNKLTRDSEEDKIQLEIKQGVEKNDIESIKSQAEPIQKIAQKFAKNEEDGQEHPLTSSGYLERIFDFINKYLEKEQENLQARTKKENAQLEKKTSNASKKIQNLQEKKKINKQRLDASIAKHNDEKKQISEKIDDIYKNDFSTINSRYKKMLGLKNKYKRQIQQVATPDEAKKLVKQFKNDIKGLSKANKEELEEETRKFNNNGERIETETEKKERKDKEKKEKKAEKEKKKQEQLANKEKKKEDAEKKNKDNNDDCVEEEKTEAKNTHENIKKSHKKQEIHAENILNDKEQNGDLHSVETKNNDDMLKDANKKNNANNQQQDEKEKKIQIDNISERKNIINNVNTSKTVKNNNALTI